MTTTICLANYARIFATESRRYRRTLCWISLAILGTWVPVSGVHAAKVFPSGSESCGNESSGDACYNCVSRTCSDKDNGGPNGGYGGDSDYTACIDDGLDACDSKWLTIQRPSGAHGAASSLGPEGQAVQLTPRTTRGDFLDKLRGKKPKPPKSPRVK